MTPRGGPRNLLHPGPPYLRATPPAAPAPPPLHRSGHLASPASSAHPHRLPRRRCRQRSSSAHGLITPQARTQNGGGVVQCACVGAAGAAGADKGRDGGGPARRRVEGGGGKVRGGVGAGQHGRRPRAPTFKSGRDGVTGRVASHVTPHAPSRALARSRVGSAGAGKSGLPLGGASWAEVAAYGRSGIPDPLNLVL